MADIIIIGGGAAGAATFGELLRRNDGSTVHWVVGPDANGRGVAYATQDEHHLLNVRAAGMGVFVDQDETFLEHASRHLGAIQGMDFLPRRLFGDFIEAQIRTRIESAKQQGRRFAIHADEAVRVVLFREGSYRVELSSGKTLTAASVILAIGALPPRPLKAVSEEALHSGAYALDPWNLAHRTVAPRRVLVIGTGLTAVDMLRSASIRWPQAELVAVSRHGLLPLLHPPLPLAPYPFQEDLNEALLSCDGVAPMLRLIREAISDATHGGWRSIIDGMRPINAQLWQGLSLTQRRQFLRHVRWLWEASRHRTAPASGEAIQQLRDEERLQVHAARVLKVSGKGPLHVTVRSRASQLESTFESDLVVQATGLDTTVAYIESELLTQLLSDGLAVADPLRLGVTALPDGQLLNTQGKPQPGLYAIGSLLRGSLWECTAMPEIRAAAHQRAHALIPTTLAENRSGIADHRQHR